MAVHGSAIKSGLITRPSMQKRIVVAYVKCSLMVCARSVFDEMPQRNAVVESAMISGYSRCRKFDEARQLFEGSEEPSVVCCNAMISMYVHNDREVEGLNLLRDLYSMGVKPNEFTLSVVLLGCSNLEALEEGKQIHAFVTRGGFSLDLAVSNSLISFYARCGRMEHASFVFYHMPDKDVYSWTAMVTGYAQNGRTGDAARLFDVMPQRNVVSWNAMICGYHEQEDDEIAMEMYVRMLRKGQLPTSSTLSVILKCCVCLLQFGKGMQVHDQAIKLGISSNVFVGSAIVDMYAKFGCMVDSQKAFDEILEQNVVSNSALASGYAQNGDILVAADLFNKMPEKNLVAWNFMIAGYVHNGLQVEALDMFSDMIQANVQPNQFTLSSILNACASPQASRNGRKVHGYAIKVGFDFYTTIGNSLITMYAEQEDIVSASAVFKRMQQYDVVSWTAMVSAYVKNNRIHEARQIFETMPEKNLISWNTMIGGYLQIRNSSETDEERYLALSSSSADALELFCKMKEFEIKPDHLTYNCVLVACASIGTLQQTRSIHAATITRGFDADIGVANALINAYGKCGNSRDAEHVFNSLVNPDPVSWNTMITGHAGEVEKGWELFESMSRDYGIERGQDHYACMVDLLGRAGQLCEAERLINDMPIRPDTVVWGALLGACKTYRDVDIARRVAKNILNHESINASVYVTMANIFADAGFWDDAAEVRVRMREKQLLRSPGCSWIEIHNRKHSFLAGDKSHPEWNIKLLTYRCLLQFPVTNIT
ncbi:Pentatricopeptide repeat-containing protein [Nymphaea thermarum]|nr:Pentatricopeptide repeat-containing protein [Nymphaea thermarum]